MLSFPRLVTSARLVLTIVLCSLQFLVSCSGGDDAGSTAVEVPVTLSAIDDLAITAGSNDSLTLTWSSPDVQAKAGMSITYELRQTSLANVAADRETWTVVVPPGADSASGVSRTYVVRGLVAEVTYVFEMRTAGGGAWSGGSNLVVGTAAESFDRTSPAAISDLQLWDITPTSLTLIWTAAGDDFLYGDPADHEVRYATEPITSGNWMQATVATGSIQPGPATGLLQITLSGLTTDTIYYCAVMATDDVGLNSGLSNELSKAPGGARVIRIEVDASGDYPTIEEGIAAAVPGDVVLVGPGRYTWSNQGTGDPLHGMINVARDYQDFEVRSLAGAEQTVLDAEGNGAVMSVTGGTTAIPGGGLDYAGIVIDGFTFTGGAPSGLVPNSVNGWAGGGINVHLSDSVIRNCIFRNNTAHDGGGVWIGGQGDAILEDCLIEDNTATYGGGIMLINSEPRITVRRCTIRNNKANSAGGGLFTYNCTMTVTDCLITGNWSGSLGGGVSSERVQVDSDLTGCTIAGNDAVYQGAGIYISNGRLLLERSVVALNQRVEGLRTVAGGVLEIGCSVVFGNEGGDEFPLGTVDLGANLFVDPLFCNQTSFEISGSSPCLSENRAAGDACGMVGASPIGCSAP